MALKTRKPTGAVPWPLILIEGEEKAGKAQPLNARIATPTGWTTMGELAVGSLVIGSDGQPHAVTAVHERGERDIYRLTFSDGATAEACDEHLWTSITSSGLHTRYNKGPKKGQRNIRPYIVRTTAEIRELLLNGTVVHIPVTSAVQYAQVAAPLPLNPYALGLLLSDGGLSKPNYPSFTSGDEELFERLSASLPAGDTLTRMPRPITAGIKGGRTTAALRALGLTETKSDTKFIPPEYMTASPDDRLALLQGLMDTDGGMEKKSVTFTSVSQRMALQVQELIRSLGGTCSMRDKHPSYRDASGQKIAGKAAYTLRMRLPVGVCPFRLERKVQAWTDVRPTFSTPPRRTVKAVDYVGKMPARCIAVDAPDHLYLTDGFVVTHNTWACAELTASPRVGRCFWIDLGEGAADEYGAIPGADYEIVEHDGSFTSLLANVGEIRDIAAKALAAGDKPVVLVIDTMTEEWAILSDWARDCARASKANKRKLAEDPNAEIVISGNYWNNANARHRQLMRLLKKFPGIVLMTSHGKTVAVIGEDGQPVEGKKEHKVEAQKTLGADASCWLRLYRDKPGLIVGGRSVELKFRPGDEPRRLAADWTLEGIIFDVLKCDPATARVRDLADRTPDTTDPDVLRREAVDPWTPVARVRELYRLAKQAGFDEVTILNEGSREELLLTMLGRIGQARAKARAALPETDGWLDAIAAMSIPEDTVKIREEMTTSFANVPDSDPRLMGLREAWAERARQIAAGETAPKAEQPVQAALEPVAVPA